MESVPADTLALKRCIPHFVVCFREIWMGLPAYVFIVLFFLFLWKGTASTFIVQDPQRSPQRYSYFAEFYAVFGGRKEKEK